GVWRFGALATTGSRGRQRWPRVDSPHVCDAGVGPRLRFGAAGFGRNGALRSRLRNRALFELHPTVALEDRSFFDLEVRRAQVAVHLRRRANLDVVAGDDVASNLALDHDGGGDDFGSHECAGPDDQRPTGMDLTRELPIDADSPFEGELAFEGAPGSEDGGRVRGTHAGSRIAILGSVAASRTRAGAGEWAGLAGGHRRARAIPRARHSAAQSGRCAT